MSKKTWSDMLEQKRANMGDTSEYERVPPIKLLNTVFDERKADSQLAEHTHHDPGSFALMTVAWSRDYVYFLDDGFDLNQRLVAVTRNPPLVHCMAYFLAGLLSERESGFCTREPGHEGDHK